MKTPITATERRCEECGGNLEDRVYKHTQKVGKWTTIDNTAFAPHCVNCGKLQMSLEQLQEYQIAAAKTVLCEGKLDGGVVRFARKALGLTQKELGLLLDYQHETVSRWENRWENGKDTIPRAAASALIGILCRALDGEPPEGMVRKAHTIHEGDGSNPSQEIEVRRRTGAPRQRSDSGGIVWHADSSAGR